MKNNKFLVLLFGTALALGIGGCAAKNTQTVAAYDFTTVSRGTLEKTVSSSGSLKPLSTVNVLPRMSGKVEKLYVDYNDEVRSGDVLAELNTDMLRLQHQQQMAQIVKARANYELQKVNYQNQQKLAEKNLISDYELKTGKTTLDIQAAELQAAEASLNVIETEINQYAYITSPIDGIVLERNISVGDSVVEGSNSNSSAIFTLAENLSEMQIEAGVGELDISGIHKGQSVRFTLEAIPGRKYQGEVASVRLMPTVSDTVVSYTVIISIDNSDLSLLPGMSCAVEFIEESREGVLRVPNAALRYTPSNLSAEEVATKVFEAGLRNMTAEQQEAAVKARSEAAQTAKSASGGGAPAAGGIAGVLGGASGGMPGMGGPGGRPGGMMIRQNGTAGGGTPARQTVIVKPLWYLDERGKPDCILVRAGLSDGQYTEVIPIMARRPAQDSASADAAAPADAEFPSGVSGRAAGPAARNPALLNVALEGSAPAPGPRDSPAPAENPLEDLKIILREKVS
jgi:HlyD family secretion protein